MSPATPARVPVRAPSGAPALAKSPSGIRGLDDITEGGFPRGRPTLVCGGAGCGKTLLAMEFLVHGATQFGEPGVFVSFEESRDDLTQNVASLGFDLDALAASGRIVVDHVYIEASEIQETGEYDLEGLFIRLGHAVDSIGARRVVLDTLEALFSGLPNPAILRAELRRLFRWLKQRQLTAVITAERGENTLTRFGIEEYVSDCVIALDHRVAEQHSTRRLRVTKYRGSLHGTDEYPFLIDDNGISVLPMTSLGLDHPALEDRVPSGIADLDGMLEGGGYYRGSTVLVSGGAGCGKTSIGAHFAAAACARGDRCLVMLFEESPRQYVRNMRSIGIDLQPWLDGGLLRMDAARPSLCGLELHLVTTLRAVQDFRPAVVVVDPISSFDSAGAQPEIKAMLIRLVDFLKGQGITVMLTNLAAGGAHAEHTDSEISSIVDTWLLLRDVEIDGGRRHSLNVLKSRGMAHSTDVREYRITSAGVSLCGSGLRS